jgi:vacuolar-type H+-ATPase subunit C/Vma6
VRALLRGAAAGVPARERLTGLIPTPSLRERALEELAGQRSLSTVAALLAVWGHPFGHPILAVTRDPQPDLLRIDALLNSTYVSCSLAAVRRAPRGMGARRDLLTYVRDTTDVENASTALQLAGQPSTVPKQALYNEGGRVLDRAAFEAIAAAPDGRAAQLGLERAFRASSLAFHRFPALSFDDATFAARLLRHVRQARLRPLGAAGILAFVMRVRAEVRDLSLIVWRLVVGAPPLEPAQLLTVR